MKRSHYVFSGFMMLLSICLFGCGTTYTYVTYDGARLAQNRVANLEFSQNYLFDGFDIDRVNVIAVDGKKADTTNGSKWNDDAGPANIELLPGNHSLHIEYFDPSSPGGTISSPAGNSIVYRRVPPSSRHTIATGEVTFKAEAGQKYVLEVNRMRTENSGILYCTIKDGAGKVVYLTNPFPPSLSKIPNDKAVVCFYRELKLAAGAAVFDIVEDGKNIKSLGNNDIYYHVAASRSHTYSAGLGFHYGAKNSTEVGANVDFNLAPGSVSYIFLRSNTNLITTEIFPTAVEEKEFLAEINGLAN